MNSTKTASAHERYVQKNGDIVMLVQLRDTLYSRSWDVMLSDLKSRFDARPYVPKLHGRIKQDIRTIEELQRYEREHNINLADFAPRG